MNTIIKTSSKFKKTIYSLILFGFVIISSSIIYMYYRSSNSCRVLQDISSNTQLNDILRQELSEFFSLPQVRTDLVNNAGEVFSTQEFSVAVPFPKVFSDQGISHNNIRLVIKSDRKDKRFIEPLEIQEVGIGYSRAYIMFNNESASGLIGDKFSIQLKSTSYVDCRVYGAK